MRNCGKIFITNNGKFRYLCDICEETFDHIELYQYHYLDEHFENFANENNYEVLILEEHEDDENSLSVSVKSELVDHGQEMSRQSLENETTIIIQNEQKKIIDNSISYLELGSGNEDDSETENRFLIDFKEVIQNKLPSISLSYDSKNSPEIDTIDEELKQENQIIQMKLEDYNLSNKDVVEEIDLNYNGTMNCQELCNENFEIIENYNEKSNSNNSTGLGKENEDVQKSEIRFLSENSCNSSNKSVEDFYIETNFSDIDNVSNPKDSDIFSCTYCLKSFCDNEELSKHIELCPCNLSKPTEKTNSVSFQCEYCHKTFYTLSGLKRHEKNIHINESNLKQDEIKENELTCKICNKVFQKPQWLLRHIETHSKVLTYNCKLCPAVFAAKHKLNAHRVSLHYDYKYPCDFKGCSKIFQTAQKRRLHLRGHTGERPYKCPLCPAAFAINRNLKAHHIYKHTNEYNFPCTYENCVKTFKTKDLRRRHINYMHIREQTHQCEECGLKFLTAGALSLHKMKKHLDYEDRPHKCDFCEKKFVVLDFLKEHRQRHTGEKPFKCDKCDSCFPRRKGLTEHKKIHKYF